MILDDGSFFACYALHSGFASGICILIVIRNTHHDNNYVTM